MFVDFAVPVYRRLNGSLVLKVKYTSKPLLLILCPVNLSHRVPLPHDRVLLQFLVVVVGT